MPVWQVTVYEVVATPRMYTVRADSKEEALGKAAVGATVAEETLRVGDVQRRDVDEDTLERVGDDVVVVPPEEYE